MGEVGIEPDLHEATGLQPVITPCDLSLILVGVRLYGPFSIRISFQKRKKPPEFPGVAFA